MTGNIQRLAWDSDFFKKNIGQIKLQATDFDEAWWAQKFSEARALAIDCLYIRVPKSARTSIAYCKSSGALPVMNQVLLSKDLRQARFQTDGEAITDQTDEKMRKQILILGDLLSGQSRFATDPRFGDAAARRLFTHWVEHSITDVGRKLWAFMDGSQVLGFVNVSQRDSIWHIDLIAVAESAQGKGVAQKLMRMAARWVQTKGGSELRVVTQDFNEAALAAYSKFGFRELNREAILHLWFS